MKHEQTNLLTRQALAASLRRHMETKPLSKITVSEIAADCGLNRKTFYYHFADIYALFKWMLEQETVEVVKKFDLLTDYREAIQFVMDYVAANKHIVSGAYDAMGREGLKRFFYDDFVGIVKSYIENVAVKHGIAVDEDYKLFLCDFFTEALAGTILSWCSGSPNRIPGREKMLIYLEHILHTAIPQTLLLNDNT